MVQTHTVRERETDPCPLHMAFPGARTNPGVQAERISPAPLTNFGGRQQPYLHCLAHQARQQGLDLCEQLSTALSWEWRGVWWKPAASCPAMQHTASSPRSLAVTQVQPCQKQPLLAGADQNSHTPTSKASRSPGSSDREQPRLQLDWIRSGPLPLFIKSEIKSWERQKALTSPGALKPEARGISAL